MHCSTRRSAFRVWTPQNSALYLVQCPPHRHRSPLTVNMTRWGWATGRVHMQGTVPKVSSHCERWYVEILNVTVQPRIFSLVGPPPKSMRMPFVEQLHSLRRRASWQAPWHLETPLVCCGFSWFWSTFRFDSKALFSARPSVVRSGIPPSRQTPLRSSNSINPPGSISQREPPFSFLNLLCHLQLFSWIKKYITNARSSKSSRWTCRVDTNAYSGSQQNSDRDRSTSSSNRN